MNEMFVPASRAGLLHLIHAGVAATKREMAAMLVISVKTVLGLVALIGLAACAPAMRPPKYLAVANQGNNTVTIYDAASGKLLKTISAGIDLPVSLAEDSEGDLIVANMGGNGDTDQGSVTIYPASSYLTETPTVITAGISRPESVALDRKGDLFVANLTAGEYGGGGGVTEYTANHYTDPPANTIRNGIEFPVSVLLAANDDLLVLNNLGVSRYAFGKYTRPMQIITRGMDLDRQILLGLDGTLYASTYFKGVVTSYKPPNYALSAKITRSDDSSFAGAIAVDQRHLFVADERDFEGGIVSLFSLADLKKPECTIQNGIDNPDALLAASNGMLLVANDAGGPTGTGSITEYDPKHCRGSSLLTISEGINGPTALLSVY